jgi:predicted Zn-dependent protease
MDDKAQKVALAKTKIERYWSSISRQNHFQLFGVDRDADPERIQTAYRTLAKQWHADAYSGLNLGESKDTLDAIFKRITDAYETVTDPKARAEYLVLIDRQAKGLSTDVNAILSAERMFDDALLKIRRRDWAGARTALTEAMGLNPDDPLMPVHFAWVEYNMAKDKKQGAIAAVEALKKVVKAHENSPLAWQYIGTICFQIDKPAEAKKAWKMCLEWEPQNVEAARGIRLINQREAQAREGSGIGKLMKKLFKKD